jgi:diguanylate cyclase (GGDEF)-like protein
MTLCIGLFDIDHFKRVNDQYGHQTGDDVLCAFAGTLQNSLREYDLVGRYGGEEFLVITPDFTGTPDNGIYERLCAKIAGLPIAARNGEIFLTTSIGVACASARITVDAIIESADSALYRAKESGRNRVCYASNASGKT